MMKKLFLILVHFFVLSSIGMSQFTVQDSPDIILGGGAFITENSVSISPYCINNAAIVGIGREESEESEEPATKKVVVYTTGNYGANWSGGFLPFGQGSTVDPAVVIGNNGYIYIGYLDHLIPPSQNFVQGVAVYNGSNWSNYIIGPTGTDKNHLWIDNSPDGNEGYLYSAWSSQGFASLFVYKSTNEGQNWSNMSYTTTISENKKGVNLKTNRTGNVLLAFNTLNSGNDITKVVFSKYDTNWNSSVIVDQINGTVEESAGFVSMAVNLKNDDIYLAWVEETGGDLDIYFSKSTNDGENWADPITITSSTNNDQWFPWIAWDPESSQTIAVIYYDNRFNVNQANTYVSYSTNGGSNWSDIKVSDNYFPYIDGDADAHDYIGIDIKGGLAYPVWADDSDNDGTVETKTSPFFIKDPDIHLEMVRFSGPEDYIYGYRDIFLGPDMELSTLDNVTLEAARILYIKPETIIPSGAYFNGKVRDCAPYTNPFDDQIPLRPQNIIIEKEDNKIPAEYSLSYNYPNPFNPNTTIQYSLPQDSEVSLKIYNSLGQEVADLVHQFQQAGSYNLLFNSNNLSSGVYFYTIIAGIYVKTLKMLLIK